MEKREDLKAGRGDCDMKRKWRRTTAGIVTTILFAFAGAALLACGQTTSKDVPEGQASLTLEANSPITPDHNDSATVVRANGRDTLEVVATVRGLSNTVGFFIPSSWGTFQGGTLSAADGYTYYVADRSGKAYATLVSSTVAGRTEIFAKSIDKQAKLMITFDFATLTLFPSELILNGKENASAIVEARGGLPPIEWWISHPQSVQFHVRDETSVLVFIKNIADPLTGAANTPPEPATLTARDAEGNEATADIYTDTANCTAATLNVTPAAGTGGGGNVSVSVTLEDFDMRGASSVNVTLHTGVASSTITLSPWIVPGLFQATQTFNDPGAATTWSLEYADKGAGCQGSIVTTTFTWN